MPKPKKDNFPRIIDYSSNNSPAELSNSAAKGKTLFMSKCASCHNLIKDMTGPALTGFLQRGPWSDRKNLYAWIRDPAGFMKKNEYTRELQAKYKITMTAFPGITDEEVNAICDYILQTGALAYGKPVAMK